MIVAAVTIVVLLIASVVVLGLCRAAKDSDERFHEAWEREQRASRLAALNGIGAEAEQVAWIFGDERPPLRVLSGGRDAA